MTRDISIRLVAESIYNDSFVRLTASAARPFRLRIDADVIEIERGEMDPDDERVASVEADARHRIEAIVGGAFEERLVDERYREMVNGTYGMRFFPFVSSRLRLKISAGESRVDVLTIDLPERFRALWDEAIVRSDSPEETEIRHAFGDERSSYVFRWKAVDTAPRTVATDVSFHLGGQTLLRVAHFPFLYWLLSLFLIAVAAFAENVAIVLATFGASLVFMLRQWNASNCPQANTLLTSVYLFHVLVTVLWLAAWRWLEIGAFALLPFFAIVVWLTHHSIGRFTRTGTLPPSIARRWAELIVRR